MANGVIEEVLRIKGEEAAAALKRVSTEAKAAAVDVEGARRRLETLAAQGKPMEVLVLQFKRAKEEIAELAKVTGDQALAAQAAAAADKKFAEAIAAINSKSGGGSASEELAKVTKAATTSAASMQTAGVSAGQLAFQGKVLRAQIADIATQLASGQNPFTILAQQGPDVAFAFQGQASAAQVLKSAFGPLLSAASALAPLLAWGAVAAAGAATAYAVYENRLADAGGATSDLNARTTEMRRIADGATQSVMALRKEWETFSGQSKTWNSALDAINQGLTDSEKKARDAMNAADDAARSNVVAESTRIVALKNEIAANEALSKDTKQLAEVRANASAQVLKDRAALTEATAELVKHQAALLNTKATIGLVTTYEGALAQSSKDVAQAKRDEAAAEKAEREAAEAARKEHERESRAEASRQKAAEGVASALEQLRQATVADNQTAIAAADALKQKHEEELRQLDEIYQKGLVLAENDQKRVDLLNAHAAAVAAENGAYARLLAQQDTKASSKSLSEVSSAISDPLSAIANSSPYAGMVIASLQALASLQDTLDGFKTTLLDAVNGLSKGGGDVAKFIGDVVGQIAPAMLEAVPKFVEGLIQGIPSILDSVAKGLPRLAVAFLELVGPLAPVLAVQFAAALVEALLNPDTWIDAGTALASSFKSAVGSVWTDLIEGLKDLLRALGVNVDGTKDQPTIFQPEAWGKKAWKDTKNFFGIDSFDVGSAWIPRTQLAVVHAGERIVKSNGVSDQGTASMGFGGGGVHVHLSGFTVGTPEQLVRELNRVLGPGNTGLRFKG